MGLQAGCFILCRHNTNSDTPQVLQTKFMNDQGVTVVTDLLPRPPLLAALNPKPLLPWLIRRVECIRGSMPLLVQCAPAFNYARDRHATSVVTDSSIPPSAPQQTKVLFESESLLLDLRYIVETTDTTTCNLPVVELASLDLTSKGHLGYGATTSLSLSEGQAVTFVLRTPPSSPAQTGDGDKENPGNLKMSGVARRPVEDPYLTKVLFCSLPTLIY